MPARARTRYFECLPGEFAPLRVHKAWEQSWLRCDECGAGEPHCSPMGITGAFGGSGTLRWVAAATLRRDLVPFAVGLACDCSLYWPVERALRLVREDGVRGMTLFHAGVIPDGDVNDDPTPLSLAGHWGRMRADRPGSDLGAP